MKRGVEMSHLKKKKAPAKQRRKSSNGSTGKIVGIILLVIILAGGGSLAYISPGRSNSRKIISEFQNACNNLEPVRILNCMYPSMTIKGIQLAIGTAQLATGEDMGNVLAQIVDAMGGWGNLPEGMTLSDFIKTVKLTPTRFGLPGKVRKVRCKATVAMSGVDVDLYVNIYLQKRYGETYIKSIKILGV